MKGLIISNSYGKYKVISDNQIFELTPRGIFRKSKETLIVGDIVEFSLDSMTIDKIYPRINYSKRPLIANIDYLAIVSSVARPDFSFELIFKFITYANTVGIKAIVVISKSDLLDNDLKEKIIKELNLLDIKYFFTNKYDVSSIEELKEFLKDKKTCFMGQSGVGKSSLLNLLDSSYARNIGEYSEALGRGKHETKEVVLLPFFDGFVGDSPGFSSLILDLEPQELAKKYLNFASYECRFNDCLHTNNVDCGVLSGRDEGKISDEEYSCYLKLLKEALELKRGKK